MNSKNEENNKDGGYSEINLGKSKKYFYAWIFGVIFSFIFTIIIWLLDPQLDRWFHLPDLGPGWYYWQLPQPILISQIIVWALYFAHQIAMWVLIYWAQKNYDEYKTKPTEDLTKFNWLALSINIIFVSLHLVQTHIWYDGLAQDVPIFTSQDSVIVMLAILLVMQHPRRGLVAGKKLGKPFTKEIAAIFRHNHVYIFSWALIYTFWFHPMDGDIQLLTGFFYMFLLFTQVSLAYTKIHLNMKWVTFLEAYVTFHALTVALFQDNIWPMFLTGFIGMIIITYIHGLGLKKMD